MSNDTAVRKCGSSFAYCKGSCDECEVSKIYATNSIDAAPMHAKPVEDEDTLGKPTKEEYEKAKQDREFDAISLRSCRKHRDELIDALVRERESEKLYMELYEKHRDIIRRYEIYEEIEANNGKV